MTPVRGGLFPTYLWLGAPEGLATRRQLAADGLRPGRQPIAGQILWRRGERVAYLYRRDTAQPKRPATPAQLAALAKAMRVRRTCPSCQDDIGYVLPRHWTACLDCQDQSAEATTQPPDGDQHDEGASDEVSGTADVSATALVEAVAAQRDGYYDADDDRYGS